MMLGPSYFGGQYVAINFAYGVVDIAPLTVHNVPITSGAKALAVAFGFCNTHDGIKFYPLATDAPINVGSDSDVEKVTPSAVSNNNDSYGGTNFTATTTSRIDFVETCTACKRNLRRLETQFEKDSTVRVCCGG